MNPISLLYILMTPFLQGNFADGRTEGSIVIQEGTLTVFGTLIDKTWSHESFVTALGKEEREYSRVDIYDTKGIMLWNKYRGEMANNDSNVTEFKTVFQLENDYMASWYCTEPYIGVVIIEGNIIDINTSYDELMAILPQYHFSSSGGTGWYDGVYKDIYIYAQFNTAVDQLIYLAIGLDEGDNYQE